MTPVDLIRRAMEDIVALPFERFYLWAGVGVLTLFTYLTIHGVIL